MPGVHVRCPVPPSGIRLSRVGVHLSAPVSSWSALVRRAVIRLGTGRVGVPPIVSATGSSAARVQAWRLELAQAALAAAASAWTRQSSWQARERWPDSTTWPTGSSRLRARIAVGRRAAGAREVRPPAAGYAQVGWRRMPACGRARLGRGPPGTGGPWPDSAECARSRQHAVPQKQSDREENPV